MLTEINKITDLKERFIIKRKELLASGVDSEQKKLLKQLLDRVIAKLDTKDANIVNSDDNMAVIASIDKLFKDYEANIGRLMNGVIGDYTQLLSFNEQYYAQFNKALFASVKKNVESAMYNRIGYNGKTFEKDGFIDSFIKDKTIARSVKQTVLSSVLNGAPLTNLVKTLSDTITGTETSSGILESHFRTYIYDTYSQFDAETGNQFAVQLDLNYAIYSGGLVDHSRPFCIVRNGKSFTREEVNVFGSGKDEYWKYYKGDVKAGGYTNHSQGEFQGKNKDYIPERDRGGYNCGHILNWVDYATAKRIRADIPKSTSDKAKK